MLAIAPPLNREQARSDISIPDLRSIFLAPPGRLARLLFRPKTVDQRAQRSAHPRQFRVAMLTITVLVASYALADLARRVPGFRAIL